MTKPGYTTTTTGVALSFNDKSELNVAIEIFGAKNVANVIAKSVDVKKQAVETIKDEITAFSPKKSDHKPGKMVRGITQVITRLARDKMWAIFLQAFNMTNMLYTNFIFKYPAPSKEVGSSSQKVYKEFLSRCTDTNERVQEKAEDVLEAMVTNEKIRGVGVLHEELLKPLQPGKEHQRAALVKADLVFYMLDELEDEAVADLIPGVKPAKWVEFGLSAVNHNAANVRKAGERVMIKLYEKEPRAVLKQMPPDNAQTRKTHLNLKYLFDEFQRMDKNK